MEYLAVEINEILRQMDGARKNIPSEVAQT